MNETASVFPARGRRNRRGGADLRWAIWIAALMALCLGGLTAGCGDDRTSPPTSSNPSHMRQYDLWSQRVSSGETISAVFTVERELADVETPVLLTLVTHLETAADPNLMRFDAVSDSLEWLSSALTRYGTRLFRLGQDLQTLAAWDSLWLIYPDSMVIAFDSTSCDTHVTICGDTIYCDSLNWAMYPDSMVLAFDTTGRGECRAYVNGLIALYGDSTTWATAAQVRMTGELADLSDYLDNAYTLALWMDSDTTTRYPNAVYKNPDLELGGQLLYSVATDSASGLKSRGMSLRLKRFESCDPVNLGETLEVNWVTCFAGSTRPCMSVGEHTLQARLNGASTRITGTLVLIYEEAQP